MSLVAQRNIGQQLMTMNNAESSSSSCIATTKEQNFYNRHLTRECSSNDHEISNQNVPDYRHMILSSSVHDDEELSSSAHSTKRGILRTKRRPRAESSLSGCPISSVNSNGGDPVATPSEIEELSQSVRSIRFADEEGKPMETLHPTEWPEGYYPIPPGMTRVIVLLMNVDKKKFEFVHIFIDGEDRNIMSDVLRHVRKQATDKYLRKQKYTGIIRPSKNGQEMINTLSIQDHYLQRDEIVVAISPGQTGQQMSAMSEPLLNNRRIMRAMKRAKWSHHRPITKIKNKRDSRKNKSAAFQRSSYDENDDDYSTVSLGSLEELGDIDDAPNSNIADNPAELSKKVIEDKTINKKSKMAIVRLLNAGMYVMAGVAYLSALRKQRKALRKQKKLKRKAQKQAA